MGALYVVLVLAVGYVYCSIDPDKKYKLARKDGYSLYFYIGFWGTIWTLAAIVIFFILDLSNTPSAILEKFGIHFKAFEPASAFTMAEIKQLLLCIGTLLFTAVLALIKKTYYSIRPSKRKQLMVNVAKSNACESMLFNSINDYQPLLFTLDSDKVYVGFVSDFDPIDGKIEFVTILPLLSGYRDERKSLQFTTNYYEHYQIHIGEKAESPDEPEMQLLLEKFRIIVPFSEVISVSGFDIDAFKLFMTSDFCHKTYKESIPSVQAETYNYTQNGSS